MDERIEEGIRVLREHLARNAEDLDLLERLLATLLAAGQPERAAVELERIVRERPELPQLHFDLLARLQHAGHGPALLDALASSGADPARRALASYGRGLLHQAASDQAAAAREYRSAIAADPRFAAAHYNLGNALQASDQVDLALESLERSLELAPRLAEPHFLLAGCYMNQRRFPEARRHFERFVELARPYHAPYVHNARQLLAVLGLLG
jgi:tetratricopeptide (TPR) repeat protein